MGIPQTPSECRWQSVPMDRWQASLVGACCVALGWPHGGILNQDPRWWYYHSISRRQMLVYTGKQWCLVLDYCRSPQSHPSGVSKNLWIGGVEVFTNPIVQEKYAAAFLLYISEIFQALMWCVPRWIDQIYANVPLSLNQLFLIVSPGSRRLLGDLVELKHMSIIWIWMYIWVSVTEGHLLNVWHPYCRLKLVHYIPLRGDGAILTFSNFEMFSFWPTRASMTKDLVDLKLWRNVNGILLDYDHSLTIVSLSRICKPFAKI